MEKKTGAPGPAVDGQARFTRHLVPLVCALGLAVLAHAAYALGDGREVATAMAEQAGQPQQADHRAGRLAARPAAPTESGPRGLQPLGLGGERDGLVYVPAGYRDDRPAPLVLMLHGAGSSAQSGLRPLIDRADEAGLILLAVDSRRRSWDVIVGGYGPDVAFIDEALARTFARYAVDPSHVAVEGFSDGASYALSLGITNGDLFTHVLAFSPGFVSPGGQEGEPRLFVSHGTQDAVLPIEQCSRLIVPMAQRAGYDVRYVEFEGGHAVPPEIARQAVAWFTDS